MRNARKRIALLIFLCFGLFARGDSGSTVSSGPDLTVDLRQFGYAYIPNGRVRFGYYLLWNRLVLLDNGTLAVSFFIADRSASSGTSRKDSGTDYLFETLFLDATSGKFLRAQQWSKASPDCALFPVPGGRFVVRHGLDLTLHGPDGKTIKSATIDPRFPHWLEVRQSPSWKTLIATSVDAQGEHVLCLSSSDLQEIARFDLHGATGSGSDSYIGAVQRAEGRESPFVRPVGRTEVAAYGPITGNPEVRRPITVYKTNDPLFSPVVGFLDDQTLALTAGHTMEILNLSGDLLYVFRAGRALVNGPTPCRDCDLVAFVTAIAKGGRSIFDTFYMPFRATEHQVLILDRKTRNLVEVPSAGWVTKEVVEPGLALAPDGCTFAHQADWRLEIYRICGTQIGRQLSFQPPGW